MTKKEISFWRKEMASLDKQYKERLSEWQELTNLYNLQFDKRIRDLWEEDLVKVSRFYPLVRQIIASIAFNYPKMFFAVEEEENDGISELYERASVALFNLMGVKDHVHQAIFDALFCGIGWLRIDFNPRGDDMIPPYTTNDAMAEDLTALNRVAPGFVHLDPLCPPHKLGHARYIREKMWVPLKQLLEDKDVKNKKQIQAAAVDKPEDIGFGEIERDDDDQQFIKDAINNGEFVLVNRIHDRMNKRLIMFVDGVEEPIQDIPHPFMKMTFPQKMDLFGMPMFEEDGLTPLLDIEAGEEAPGWLVENGFPFIPVKFDLNADSFYPTPHLKYVEDIQYSLVESLSRRRTLLRRTARTGLVNEEELKNDPEIAAKLKRSVDGEWIGVLDKNNFQPLEYGAMLPDQTLFERDIVGYEEGITRVTDLTESGATPRTATEASLIASQLSVNREWMESAVSDVYEQVVRNCFQIMGDPRYTPEDFLVNVAPDGAPVAMRAMRSADFMWNYRITVAAGSTQPLFEQIQQEQFLAFYDRASQRPSFDQMELDKMLATSAEVDVDKVIQNSENPEAVRAAQMENQRMMSTQQDPGVIDGQDHEAHLKTHQTFQSDPTFQQMAMLAQQRGFDGQPADPGAVQRLQQAGQLIQQHMKAHQQAMLQQIPQQSGAAPRAANPQGITSTVRGNAQDVQNVLSNEAQQATDGA